MIPGRDVDAQKRVSVARVPDLRARPLGGCYSKETTAGVQPLEQVPAATPQNDAARRSAEFSGQETFKDSIQICAHVRRLFPGS